MLLAWLGLLTSSSDCNCLLNRTSRPLAVHRIHAACSSCCSSFGHQIHSYESPGCWPALDQKIKVYLYGIWMQQLCTDWGDRTTYIDWRKIRWLEAPFGTACIGSAYFYHHDLVSMSNPPKSLMALRPPHSPDCNDYYIRSI